MEDLPTAGNEALEMEKRIGKSVEALDPAIFNLAEISQCVVTTVSSGHHNYNFRIELNNDPKLRFMVRFHPESTTDEDVIKSEYEKIKSLNGFHAPLVCYVGKFEGISSSVLIMEYVEGEHKEFDSLTDEEISSLATAVKDIHGITGDVYSSTLGGPGDLRGSYLDYAEALISSTIDNRIAELNPAIYEADTVLINSAIEKLHTSLRMSTEAFAGTQFSTLHTDIWPLNVIWDENEVTFVDWEDMCFGDPADEVAYLFAINNVNEQFRDTFLKAYMSEATDPYFMERLNIYTLKARLFDLIWSIKKLHEQDNAHIGHIKKEEGVYEGFYAVRVEALKKYLDSL